MQPTQSNNPFTSPDAPGGGEKAPRPRDMVGALVAYCPRSITLAGAPGNTTGVGGSEPRDRVTADLIILDMPAPIEFGGSPEYEQDPKPHTSRIVPGQPAKFTGVWVGNTNIVRALAPGGQPLVGAMVLGRIERSNVGQRPFNLVDVAGTPDMTKAVDIYTRISMGQLAYQEPQPISGYAAPANAIQYAPQPVAPAPAANAPDPSLALVGMYGGIPQQDPRFGVGPQQQDPNYLAWVAQQAAGNAAVAAAFPGAQVIAGYAPPVAPVGPPPPPGWTEAGWNGLTPDQKNQVLASLPPQPR